MSTEERGDRKTKQGRVISSKMDKTVVVEVRSTIRHKTYGKIVERRQKLYAHNELKSLKDGDIVTVEETRPLSKLKRWRVVETA